MLDMDTYQAEARKTAIYPMEPAGIGLHYCTLGLNGEAGEVAEQVKKMLRDDSGLITTDRLEALRKELGDVMWYAANLAEELGEKLSDICAANLAKLQSRQERGALHGSGDER